jgi:hypothetical protein
MSQVIDQADELRKRAIEILLVERAAIDERLTMLAYNGTPIMPSEKQRICGICGSPDHNARRCPKKNAGEPVADTSQ